MKQQSEATSREYDRLLDEHAKLQVCSLTTNSYRAAAAIEDAVPKILINLGQLHTLA